MVGEKSWGYYQKPEMRICSFVTPLDQDQVRNKKLARRVNGRSRTSHSTARYSQTGRLGGRPFGWMLPEQTRPYKQDPSRSSHSHSGFRGQE